MDRSELQRLVDACATQRQIADHFDCGQSNVRYWLKKYGLKTKWGARGKLPKDYVRPRKCSCGETDSEKFYGNKTQICAKCQNAYNVERGRGQKSRAVEYLGGECAVCGWKAFDAGFDLHHKTKNKDPRFTSARYWSWERFKKELDGCVLLCSNCHRGVHAGKIDLDVSGCS